MYERKKIRSFEDLMVWQMGIDLVKSIYRLTIEGDLKKDFGLRDQLRRAAVSVPTNIAEGFELSSRKEYLRHLNIAKGSAGEVRSLLRVAWEVGYIEEEKLSGTQRCGSQIERVPLQPYEEYQGRTSKLKIGASGFNKSRTESQDGPKTSPFPRFPFSPIKAALFPSPANIFPAAPGQAPLP